MTNKDFLLNETGISNQYKNWFLDYASYVILERAVPALQDGLKPVQRRILHSMKEMDDGRFNKVANIIGQSMQYHPHGDVSIGEALVNLGQKDLLIETQGNWGDVRTGDDAAAAERSIEFPIGAEADDFEVKVIAALIAVVGGPGCDDRAVGGVNRDAIGVAVVERAERRRAGDAARAEGRVEGAGREQTATLQRFHAGANLRRLPADGY